MQQALIDHQAYTAEHRVLRADGTTRILQTHVTVEVDTAGTPRRVVGTAQDVTEQKAVAARAEAEAARTRVLLRVAARLTQEQEVTAVLHALCEETAHVLQVPIAYVVLVDPTSEVLERVVGVGLPPDDARLRTPLARTRYQHYVGQQDYIVVPDLAAVPAAPSSALQQALNIRTVVSMNITRQETLVGALVVMTRDVVRHVTADELALLRGLADQAAQAIATTQLFEEVRRSHQRLRRLSQQLVTSQEAERRRLSRELHDEAGQALTALELSLQMIAGELPPTAAALRARLVDAISLTGTTLEQLRVLAQDLRPPALDTLGLNLTLEGFCHSFAQRTGLAIRYTGTELPGLPDALTIALYRLLQEALTNVVKHAHAHHVDVVLQGDEATIQLAIGDDGGGFDVPAVLGCPGAAPGIGLAGMQERLGLLGGVLEIASAPGQGTRVVARIGVAPGAAPGDRGARRPRAGQSASGGGDDG